MQNETTELILFIIATTTLILIMGGFILTILLLYRKKQLKNEKELQNLKNEFEKDLLQAQLEIQEQTFQEISREIHDNINLTLTLAKLKLNTTHENKRELDYSIQLIGNAISELTDLSRSMNSDIIKECGLLSALSIEVERIKRINQLHVELLVSGNPAFLDAQKELFIFRIVQEAINNILKHSKAKNVSIKLDYSMSQLKIEIHDDGIGLNKEPMFREKGRFPSAGFRNMKKRIELMNGDFRVQSGVNKGTHIVLTLPVINVA
jgi:signal transduction histidine kinase